MITGIYLLTFGETYRYVGQAVDVEARLKNHADSFASGKAASKLLNAFLTLGLPEATLLTRCHRDHLDALEAYFINEYHDENSLNTMRPTPTISVMYDDLLEYAQMSFQDICAEVDDARAEADHFKSVAEGLERDVDVLEQARTQEEMEADITGTIYRQQKIVEDLGSDLKYYKDQCEKVYNMPWYKRIFLKAPL